MSTSISEWILQGRWYMGKILLKYYLLKVDISKSTHTKYLKTYHFEDIEEMKYYEVSFLGFSDSHSCYSPSSSLFYNDRFAIL